MVQTCMNVTHFLTGIFPSLFNCIFNFTSLWEKITKKLSLVFLLTKLKEGKGMEELYQPEQKENEKKPLKYMQAYS